MLLNKEPSNLQAQSLAALIEKSVSKDGLIGLAMVGGVAALTTAVVVGLLKKR